MKTKKSELNKVGMEIESEVGTEIAEDKIEVGTEIAADESLFEFDLPEVSEKTNDFIQADNEETENTSDNVEGFVENNEAEKYRGNLDDKCGAFDPLIHAYPPEKTGKFGKWKKLPKNKQQQKAVDEVKSNSSYRGEAQKFATLYGESHRLLFGEGGKVIKDEIIPLVDSLERYMLENGHTEISAGWDVLLSSGMYSFAITQRETNKEKVKKYFSSVLKSLKSLVGIKEKKKEAQNEKENN